VGTIFRAGHPANDNLKKSFLPERPARAFGAEPGRADLYSIFASGRIEEKAAVEIAKEMPHWECAGNRQTYLEYAMRSQDANKVNKGSDQVAFELSPGSVPPSMRTPTNAR